jgi:hypothetical protein
MSADQERLRQQSAIDAEVATAAASMSKAGKQDRCRRVDEQGRRAGSLPPRR